MVERSSNPSAESLNCLIVSFFKENLPLFSLTSETAYGPYWGASFLDHNGVEVKVRGENDGFDVVVRIDEEEYPLWKFDRNVIDASDASEENILYQLSVLKSFLK